MKEIAFNRMHLQSHQTEQQRNLLKKLREDWAESEWRLMFLRSDSARPTNPATQEEIVKWAEQK